VASIKVHWETPGGTSKLVKNIQEVDPKIRRAIGGAMDWHADRATEYAKLNAPWTDRTGAARSGLFSTVATGLSQDHWELILSHSVYYGIYLEVCNSGKYAIIMPTIRYIGDMLIRNMSHMLDRIEAQK
jgi:hypothetical protein